MEKNINYPTEIIFKSVFRSSSDTMGNIKKVLDRRGIQGEVTGRPSRNGTFISYTITAVFPSNETLNETCTSISSLNGFMTMF
ncbi:DUF493 family protein [Spirochaetota bacterium]